MSVKILIFCQSMNVGLCYINKYTGHCVCFFFQGGAKGMGGGPGGMFGFGQSTAKVIKKDIGVKFA